MAEKEDRKSKRSQKTAESRNISSNKFEGVYLEASCTMNTKKISEYEYVIWQDFMFSCIMMNFIQIDANEPASSYAPCCFQCWTQTYGEGPGDVIAWDNARFCTKSSVVKMRNQLCWFLELYASCRREERIAPPTTCNTGRLPKQKSANDTLEHSNTPGV